MDQPTEKKGPSQSAEPKSAEELISTCTDDPGRAPFYVICFGQRPLQVIPPGARGAHLAVFTKLGLAEAFVRDRARHYADEALGISPVASIAAILRLCRAESIDPEYIRPPCGVAVDFTYPLQMAALTLSPAQVSKMNSAQLAKAVSH